METIVSVKSTNKRNLVEVTTIKKEGCQHGFFKAKESSFFVKNSKSLSVEAGDLVEIKSSSRLTILSILLIFVFPILIMGAGALAGTVAGFNPTIQSILAVAGFFLGGAISVLLLRLIETKSKPSVEKILTPEETELFYEDCAKVCEGCARNK
ncbi:MAG: SoxR reducing system RseC family protein [Spirochaetales bacterium]|nr:SoxR reducing system RseC family protein [Spirochaetales bacterium]